MSRFWGYSFVSASCFLYVTISMKLLWISVTLDWPNCLYNSWIKKEKLKFSLCLRRENSLATFVATRHTSLGRGAKFKGSKWNKKRWHKTVRTGCSGTFGLMTIDYPVILVMLTVNRCRSWGPDLDATSADSSHQSEQGNIKKSPKTLCGFASVCRVLFKLLFSVYRESKKKKRLVSHHVPRHRSSRPTTIWTSLSLQKLPAGCKQPVRFLPKPDSRRSFFFE